MTSKYYTINFAQAYGQDNYSDCQYNDTTACPTSGGGNTGGGNAGAGGAAPGGQLTDTGFAIVAIVTLAAVLVLVAIVVRVWRRPAKKLAPEHIAAQDNDNL
jgi:hypothetical protein